MHVCHNKGVSLVLDDCTVNDKANERYYNTLTLLISFKNTERENWSAYVSEVMNAHYEITDTRYEIIDTKYEIMDTFWDN